MRMPVASWPLCVVLVLAALAGAARETRYDKFLRQHVDYPQTPLPAEHRYCDIMVARRRVMATQQSCKYTNTFVHAPAERLVAACSQEPDAYGFYSTPTVLSITICRLRGRNTRPPCNYRVQRSQQYVRVSCQRGLPVHLNGTYVTQ